MNTKEYFYLSDEELMHLIDLSETDGLLPAPKQLKSAILTAAARAPRPLTRAEKRKQFLAYCARVGVACAACLGQAGFCWQGRKYACMAGAGCAGHSPTVFYKGRL